VDEDVTVSSAVSRLLPERLWRLQRATGVPVTFGGPTRLSPGGRQIMLTRLSGTLGESLRGLTVDTGRGLGGVVLRDKAAQRVLDYASTSTIAHDFDGIVVGEERLTSMLAMHVTVGGTVRAVLYGAVRESSPIGDRAVSAACAVAEQMARDVASQAALTELATLIGDVPDPQLRARMARLCQALGSDREPPASIVLAPRERDVLRIAAVGATNVEIAAQLGLSPQTVKAYMRAAMRKLGVHNRTAALHAARLAAAI
jgi:LuxR family transcriptional regulator, regulator of acetate metabolism